MSVLSDPSELSTVDQSNSGLSKLLCCECGLPIPANSPTFVCASCIASTADVTSHISTEAQLHQCRGCQRWHKEDAKWLGCELESRELMALCLHKVSGLKNVKLVDASWVWTEPHSMRIKTKLTIQKQVEQGVILQQSFLVVFVVRNMQCPECQAEFCQGSWKSLVQVRQRVDHKRTFLYLEQAILKHNAHRGCLSIETFRDGMDFYFPDRSKARSFIEFLESVTPMQCKDSKKLIGTDLKSNVSNYKFTHFIDICPLCKDDLLHLPKKVATKLGSIGRTILVKNVSSVIHLVDPFSGQTAEMPPAIFYRSKFRPLVTAARAHYCRYVVLSKEAVVEKVTNGKRSTSKQRNRLAELTLVKEDDLGQNDNQHVVRSHIGYLLKSGDVVLGYHLAELTLVDDEAEHLRTDDKLSDVVIIRKLYGGVATGENEAEAAKKRSWRLQRLDVEASDENEKSGKAAKKVQTLNEIDEEDFLREVEADKDLRANINLYKYEGGKPKTVKFEGAENDNNNNNSSENSNNNNKTDMADDGENDGEGDGDGGENGHSDSDEDDQKVQLDELLDGLALDAKPDVADDGDENLTNFGKVYTEEELENMTELERFQLQKGRVFYEDGERAKQDNIGFVDKDASRDVAAKSGASVVAKFGESFMNTKYSFK